MSVATILLPVFTLVFLIFAVGGLMAARRATAFKTGTHYRDIALREPAWPVPALQAQYAFSNLFELPVLFFVVMILALVTRHADFPTVVLAWVFVAARFLQAYIHITSNYVPYRGAFYLVGAVALLIMWIWFALRILLGLS